MVGVVVVVGEKVVYVRFGDWVMVLIGWGSFVE